MRYRNSNIRESVGVTSIVEKMVKNSLRWFVYVERRLVDSVVSSSSSKKSILDGG